MDNTTQKKKSILRNIINTVSGAGDTLNNIASTIKANNGINSNINTLAIKAAQNNINRIMVRIFLKILINKTWIAECYLLIINSIKIILINFLVYIRKSLINNE